MVDKVKAVTPDEVSGAYRAFVNSEVVAVGERLKAQAKAFTRNGYIDIETQGLTCPSEIKAELSDNWEIEEISAGHKWRFRPAVKRELPGVTVGGTIGNFNFGNTVIHGDQIGDTVSGGAR